MQNLQKHRIAQTLLATNQTVRVVLDSRVAEVDVPDNLLGRDQIALDIGWNMVVPIPDLYLSEHGFSGTLVFRGVSRHVFVPWAAVYSLYVPATGAGSIWGTDMPNAVQDRLVDAARKKSGVFGVIPKAKTFDYPPASGAKVVSLDEFRSRKNGGK